jgi:alcohol dehydrogenase
VTLVGATAVTGEPGLADVEEPVARYRDADVSVVLGVGGGAVLDTAKAIAGLLRSGTSLMDHLEGVGRGLPYPGPALPVVAVPTTAGTGAEATRNAVITERGPQGYKRSFRDERLVPADAVVDPDLLATAPRSLIAANGLDALTQLLEAYTSQRATPITDGLARCGLAAVREGLLAWHAQPGGAGAAAARSHMAYAALLSGICLANAGLGAVHGLASPLGGQLPIPHGMACGAVLWQTAEANIAALGARAPDAPALSRYADAGRILAGLPPSSSDDEARAGLIRTLRAWVEQLEVQPLSAFGMSAAHIAAVVADSPGSSMQSNPVLLTDAELTGILERAL